MFLIFLCLSAGPRVRIPLSPLQLHLFRPTSLPFFPPLQFHGHQSRSLPLLSSHRPLYSHFPLTPAALFASLSRPHTHSLSCPTASLYSRPLLSAPVLFHLFFQLPQLFPLRVIGHLLHLRFGGQLFELLFAYYAETFEHLRVASRFPVGPVRMHPLVG